MVRNPPDRDIFPIRNHYVQLSLYYGQNLYRNTMTTFFEKPICWLVLLATLLLTSCTESTDRVLNLPITDLTTAALIPLPQEMRATNSGFALDEYTALSTAGAEDFADVSAFLAKAITDHTGLQIPTGNASEGGALTVISLEQTGDLGNSEAYRLVITEDSIRLQAGTAAGAFRGVQTIRQLIPHASTDTLAENPIWVIPTGTITDEPQYVYRASMLDVSRHFFGVDDVKKYIDLMAYYKMNTLHLHLSDDQGWRIEIKSWPRLTEVGGSTEVDGGEGGFFTQEQYTEIVQYAADHHITVVPEIDMPGHTNAASVAYPILNGNGKTPELYTGREVGFSTFDSRKDTVYAFIDDVVREIAALTPGPYFHIGGDESHVTEKPDYNYFVERVQGIVQKHGKRMMGWDEIVTADIDSTAIAQVWANKENGEQGIAKGMKLILSPSDRAYLDMKYDSSSTYGYTWAGLIPVDVGYDWDPEEYFPKEHVLGLDAPLWSETIAELDELEYLAFPRLLGYAELGWTTQDKRDWETYRVRLGRQAPFLERMNVNFYRSEKVDWE